MASADRRPPTPDFSFDYSQIGLEVARFPEVLHTQPFRDQAFLIFGADPDGMGGAAALMAVQGGAWVYTSSRDGENALQSQAFAEKLNDEATFAKSGGGALWLPGDITIPHDRKNVIDQVLESSGGQLDSVIITPAIRGKEGPVALLDEEAYIAAIRGNTLPSIALIKDLFNRRKRKNPEDPLHIVVTSSITSEGAPMQGPYGGSKALLEMLAKTAAREAINLKDRFKWGDISINVVSPGVVATDFVGELTAEQIDFLLKESGADRPLDPKEPAALMLHLGSQLSEGRTGLVVPMIGKGPMPFAA